ncbi:MAG: VCBS repeat-containing protein [Ignavibacteria bacterium]|nr:VCBS repeat-containing protein [Ignavibacteria bacterium]MBT8391431.1 VCBS repeat-containing protein [Ignavibacteria bacterium]
MRIYFIALAVILLNLSIVAQGEFSVNDILPATQSMSSLPETEIAINFNSSFDINSINDTTFQVWGRWSGVHKGTISISNDSTTLHFDPDKNFFYGEWITVSLSKGIKDKEGNFLPSGFAWNFWIRTLPGTMNLTRTQTINVRQLSEGWIQTYGTYAGDLDGDGWSDFIVPNEIPADIRVFMNDQQGGYDDFTIFTINSGSRPSTNEGFDYNLDGLMDFTVGNSTNNKVTVFMGDGTGSFSNIQNHTADIGVRGLVILDANGDGFPDIVTANRDADNASILINSKDGTFSPPINFEGKGNGETAAATSDVNGDGKMDLFLGAIYSDEVMLWLGNGNGSFTFSDKVSVGNGPWMVGSGDVNNDGIPDVVCANSSGSNFSVILCDSAGNLSLPTNYSVGSFPIAIDLGDVDGDLDLDIVTSNFTGANFTLYENNGEGVFINRNDLPANQAGSCAVFHDRDNDGDMDMTGIDELQDLLILFTNDPTAGVNLSEDSPEKFILFQNFPNPFNPTTNIKFTIPITLSGVEGSLVVLKVYDVLGNEIITLVNEEKQPGTYELDFNARGLPNGMYFYTLKVGSFSETKKMVLLK